MLFGFVNHERSYPLSLNQYIEVLQSYGIKGFEWKTKEFVFNHDFDDVL